MSSPRLHQLLALLEESPDDSFLLFAIAKEYEGAGQAETAREYYHRLLEEDPEYIGVYYHLGKLCEKQGDLHQAFAIYGKGMEMARRLGDQHALSELAGARLQLGDDEDFL